MSTKEAAPTTTSKTTTSNRMGRRAAIATVAAAGAVGIAVIAGPKIANDVEQGVENLGHQALTHELDSLETISLDDAIRAAEITKAAVQVIVVPLARLVALIGGDALGILLASLNAATDVLGSIHVNIAVLSALRSTVADWHTNISSLPIALTSYTTANIDNAEAYLKALKKSTQSQ